MGLYLQASVIPALLIGSCRLGRGAAIIAREGAAARKKAVPFRIFLAIGGLAGVLAGPELIELYETRSSSSGTVGLWPKA